MKISKEEFETKVSECHNLLLEALAENNEVSLEKFSNMACFLENTVFFAPLLYGILKDHDNTKNTEGL